MFFIICMVVGLIIVGLLIFFLCSCAKNRDNYTPSNEFTTIITREMDEEKIKATIIIPYWKNKQENLKYVLDHYNNVNFIHDVMIIQHTGGYSTKLPRNTVYNPNDLRLRFRKPRKKSSVVIICDDDIIVQPETMYELIYHYIHNINHLVGLWGRRYSVEDGEYRTKNIYGFTDAVLTKFFIADSEYYNLVSDIVTKYAAEFGVPRLNGEDLFFNFIWSKFIGPRYAIHQGEYSHISQNWSDIIDNREDDDLALSKKNNHHHERNELVAQFELINLYPLLTYKPRKIAICMWYDDGIAEYADYAYKINKKCADFMGWDIFKEDHIYQKDRKPNWQRFGMMKKIMQENKHDYVIWIDADACFLYNNNTDDNLLKLLHIYQNYDIIFSEDKEEQSHHPWANINSGVIIMKNSPYSISQLDWFMSDQCFNERLEKNYMYEDQGCIRLTWGEKYNDIRKKAIIVPFGTIQTFGYFYPEHQYSLIRHFTNGMYLKNNVARRNDLTLEWELIAGDIHI